jgi:hypothetical protein
VEGGEQQKTGKQKRQKRERQRESVSSDAQNGALSGVELASQELWAWLAHLVCIAPSLSLSLSLSLSPPFRYLFLFGPFVRLMMSSLDANFRGGFGEPGILGGS